MRRVTIGLLVLIASLLLATTGVQAKATKTPFTHLAIVTAEGVPERMWMDEEGILHIRGLTVTFDQTGDMTGTSVVVANLNIDPSTGNGHMWGSRTFVGTWHSPWGDLSGTFEGRFTGTLTAGALFGKRVSHGSGGFEGMKEKATVYSIGPGVSWNEGIILNPHG